MICLAKNEQGAEILLDYCAGTLAPKKTIELDRHIASCGDCRQLIAAQQQVWQVLDHFEGPEISADFDRRLYARIARERELPAWRRWLSGSFAPLGMPVWKPVLAGAVACVALAVGVLQFSPKPANEHEAGTSVMVSPDQSKTAQADRVDVDQLEQALEDLDMLAPQPTASRM